MLKTRISLAKTRLTLAKYIVQQQRWTQKHLTTMVRNHIHPSYPFSLLPKCHLIYLILFIFSIIICLRLSPMSILSKDKNQAKFMQKITDFVHMQFVLKNPTLYTAEKNKKKAQIFKEKRKIAKIVQPTITSKLKTKPSISTKGLFGRASFIEQKGQGQCQGEREQQVQDLRLKYVMRLSDQHFVIGNQYQIDMIKIYEVVDNTMDIQYMWSITCPEVITSVSVEQKFQLIALSTLKKVYVKKYWLKKDDKAPAEAGKCSNDEQIKCIRFVKNTGMYVIGNTKLSYFRINWISQKAEMNKTLEHVFELNNTLSILEIPQAAGSVLNIYFCENNRNDDKSPDVELKYGIYMQSYTCNVRMQKPEIGSMLRIFGIDQDLRDQIQVFNFNKQICLIQLQNKMIAFKNGFVIDAISTNIHHPSCFIKYVPDSKTLFHFLDENVDVYYLNMRDQPKPQKFSLICLDCISLKKNMIKESLIDVLYLGNNVNVFFFQSNTPSIRMKGKNPVLNYTFAITQKINLKEKINQIYPSPQNFANFTFDELYQKSAIVQKLGLTKIQAFLELWNRSKKTSVQDFQFLLSTKDFNTIQREIHRKLITTSMPIRQIIKIFHEALNDIANRVYSIDCTIKDLEEYCVCHFQLRKLEVLRRILKHLQAKRREKKETESTLYLNIKDYNEYKEMCVTTFVQDLAAEYTLSKNKQILFKLKSILKNFKIICKIKYYEILEKLIHSCKFKIVSLLEEIPELLPYLHEEETSEDQNLALWQQLTDQELQDNLFLCSLKTIDNKDIVDQFVQLIWFQRFQNTTHGVITIKKKNIHEELNQRNAFDDVFYFFFTKYYEGFKFTEELRQLIAFVEERYKLVPEHLQKKVQLYLFLYSILSTFHKSYELSHFLRLKQHELFKMYFEIEKHEISGFILKKIKPLYETILPNGKDVFNHGMLKYFLSDLSVVSDLKTIFNKLNNEKNEFHINAQALYEVLIYAIMRKLKIGSENDTPIDEILVYIQNIPFPVNNEKIMTYLSYIQEINYESEMLKRIKVNMTLEQIIKEGPKVIQMMVEYEIERHEVKKIRQYRSLRLYTYKILAQIQCRKSNIYGDKYHKISLKIYLINLMNNIDIIPLCKELILDKYLVGQFSIDDAFKEEVVLHLYQWNITQKAASNKNPYEKHLPYINLLKDFLSPDNLKRIYIELSNQYAAMFTFENFKIEPPLYPTYKYYPGLFDIESVFDKLSNKELLEIDIESLINIMRDLKELGESQMKMEMNHLQQYEQYKNKMRLQAYEIYLKRLIEERQLKKALEVIKTIFTIPKEYESHDIIYLIMIIEKIHEELLFETCKLFNQIVSYYFHTPKDLCRILENVYARTFSNQELNQFLQSYIDKRKHQIIFNSQNDLFQPKFRSQHYHSERCNEILEIAVDRILKESDIFTKKHTFQILFRMMSYDAMIVSKWIWCKGSGLNMKTFRSFISFMSTELIYNATETLNQAIQILYVLYLKYTKNIFFSEILKFRGNFSQKVQLEKTQFNAQPNQQSKPLKLILHSIQILEKKKRTIEGRENQHSKQEINDELKLVMLDPMRYVQRKELGYIYNDKDDGYEVKDDELSIKSKWKNVMNSNSSSGEKTESNNNNIANFIYEYLPPPQNTKRIRKVSECFPEMFDYVNIPDKRLLVPSKSLEYLNQINQKVHLPLITFNYDQTIHEEEGELNNSSLLIKKSNSRKVQTSRQLMRLNSCDSEKLNDDDLQMAEIVIKKESLIKIQIHGEQKKQIKLLISRLFEEQMESNQIKLMDEVKEYIRLRNYSYEEQELIVQLLVAIYAHQTQYLHKKMHIIAQIIRQYQHVYHVYESTIQVFEHLSQYQPLKHLPFNILDLITVDNSILDLTAERIFQSYLQRVLPTINIIEVFIIEEFTQCIFGQAKAKILIQQFIFHMAEKLKQLNFQIGKDYQEEVFGENSVSYVYEGLKKRLVMFLRDRCDYMEEIQEAAHDKCSSEDDNARFIGSILITCLDIAKVQL